jgi:predicted Rdx family selenoprotein
LAEEILGEHAAEVKSFKLIPSDSGRFEFVVDDDLIFSKKKLKRHAEPGEVMGIFKKHMGL